MISGYAFNLGSEDKIRPLLKKSEEKSLLEQIYDETTADIPCTMIFASTSISAERQVFLQMILAYPSFYVLQKASELIANILARNDIYSVSQDIIAQTLSEHTLRVGIRDSHSDTPVKMVDLATFTDVCMQRLRSKTSCVSLPCGSNEYIPFNCISDVYNTDFINDHNSQVFAAQEDSVTLCSGIRTQNTAPLQYVNPFTSNAYSRVITDYPIYRSGGEQLVALHERIKLTLEKFNRMDNVILFGASTKGPLYPQERIILQALHVMLHDSIETPENKWYTEQTCYNITNKLSLSELHKVLLASIGNILLITISSATLYLSRPEFVQLLNRYRMCVTLVFIYDINRPDLEIIEHMQIPKDELFELSSKIVNTKSLWKEYMYSLLKPQCDDISVIDNFLEQYPKRLEREEILISSFANFVMRNMQRKLTEDLTNTCDLDERVSMELALGCNQCNTYSNTDFNYLQDWNSKLENLVGLHSVKNAVRNIINSLTISQRRGIHETSQTVLTFEGNPGCGKTTTAKYFAYALKSAGCLDDSKAEPFYDIRCKELIGQHIGEAAKNVDEMFTRCAGSVIFIDEAYELLNDYDYGKTVLSQLAKNISHMPPHTIVILAGYPAEMTKLLKANPGIESRVSHRIQFDDYSCDELLKILEINLFDKLKFDTMNPEQLKEAKKLVKGLMCRVASSDEPSGYVLGNGRYINNLANEILSAHAKRVLKTECENINALQVSDFQDAIDASYKEYLRVGSTSGSVSLPYLARVSDEDKLSRIIGNATAKGMLKDVIDIIRNPQKYQKTGAVLPKGILLTGPAGCGKTSLARAVAHEASCAFIAVTGSQFIQEYSGKGAVQLREIFESASKFEKCIIFIDEIDAIGKTRTHNLSDTLGNQALMQLLTCMDGFTRNKQLFVLAATNHVELLDPALVRPGRFDYVIPVGLPNRSERTKILRLYLGKYAAGVNVNKVARLTTGASGACLKTIINTAKIRAAKDKALITTATLIDAVTDQVIGYKDNIVLNEDSKMRTAIHEIGHAAVLLWLCPEQVVERITIIPREGGTLGFTWNSVKTENVCQTKEDLLNRIKILLAGKAAEEVVLGTSSAGSASDLEQATKIIFDMLAKYGMSSKQGLCVFDNNTSQMRLIQIEDEAKELLNDCFIHVSELITKNKEQLIHCAKYLSEVETLDGDEFRKMLIINKEGNKNGK